MDEKIPIIQYFYQIETAQIGNGVQYGILPRLQDEVGGINMIGKIMDSSERRISQMISWRVSELEPLVKAQYRGSVQAQSEDELSLKLQVVKTELLDIIRVVKAQVKVFENFNQFQYNLRLDQIGVVYKTINSVIKDRKDFCNKIENMLNKLQVVQNKIDENMSKEAAKAREVICEHLTLVATAAAESTKAAVESKEAAILSMEAAAQSATASGGAVEASNRAAEAAAQSAIASQETAKASKHTAEAAKDNREASTRNTKETQGQGTKMTVFTVITTVFTPLNFITSYLGMNLNDIRNTSLTQRQFWVLTAPISLAILTFVLIVAFKCQWITRLFDLAFWKPPSGFVFIYKTPSSADTLHQSSTGPEEGTTSSADVEAQSSTRVVRSEMWPWRALR